jgi:LytS/YehU family sensor histidine kinase
LNPFATTDRLTFAGVDAIEVCGICIILLVIVAFFMLEISRLRQANRKLYRISKMTLLEKASIHNQLNSHFVFNSMVRLQNDLAIGDTAVAMDNLTKFSRFMRKTLNNSKRQVISLEEEIEQISSYLILEKIRFPKGLDFEIKISDNLEANAIRIPSLIVQPFVERSVLRGFSKGLEHLKILLYVKTDNKDLIIAIQDSNDFADHYDSSAHPFNAIDVIKDRIKLLNKFGIKCSVIKEEVSSTEHRNGNKIELRFEIRTLTLFLNDDLQQHESIFL